MSAVLVIEDVEDNYFLISKIIGKYPVELFWAHDGAEAMELFEKHQADLKLILLDIRLPDISGLEIAKKIRETNNTVPIVAQTAFAMSGDKQKALDSGCSDYISKPIDILAFKKILNRYLSE